MRHNTVWSLPLRLGKKTSARGPASPNTRRFGRPWPNQHGSKCATLQNTPIFVA